MVSSHRQRAWRFACAAGVFAAILAGTGAVAPGLRDVSLSLGDTGMVRIGAVRLGYPLLGGSAFAQASDGIVLENVTIALDIGTYRMPKIEFAGVNLSRSELAALFDRTAGEPLAPRLARLSARRITVPELVVEQEMGGARQVTTYRDVVADAVENGRIASLATAGGSFAITGFARGSGAGSYGRTTITGLDLAYVVRLLTERADTQTAELRPVYDAVTVDDVRIQDADGGEASIGRLAGTDLRARATRDSWAATIKALGATQDLDDATPQERARAVGILADMLEAFSIGTIEATDIAIRDARNDEVRARIGRIAYRGESVAGPAESRIEGLSVEKGAETFRIAALSWHGLSIGPTLAALREVAAKPDDEVTGADLRRLIPDFGTFRISGVDVDLKTGGATAEGLPEIRLQVKDVTITADKPINGIPSNLRVAVENLAFPVPPAARDDTLKQLAALGYRAVDMSWRLAAAWSEADNEVVIREVSLHGKDMGTIALTGVIGHVTREVFDADEAVAFVALLGASARSVHLTLDNAGLVERLIAMQARKRKQSPEAVRKEFAAAAAIGIPAMLGNSQAAKELGQALARFVAKPGGLSISIKARDPGGLGLSEIMTLSAPAEVLDKLEITATAN